MSDNYTSCECSSGVKTPSRDHIEHEFSVANRRTFLMAGLGLFLAGCAQKATTTALPGPIWRPRDLAPFEEPIPTPTPMPASVLPRTQWAGGSPVPSLMNPMLPVRYITVHHDGMDPFHATDARSTTMRLEKIRMAHRGKGWGDIGYHYIVDRDGRVWQGRPLNWQGAHVKDHNEGNIGVVALGNFDRQAPSSAQIAALNRQLSTLMRQYRVPISSVKTHQEWAPTACPGTNLQRYMVAVRNNRQLG
jgi:hypothetical protein